VITSNDFHPDLRRVARVLPRTGVTPRTLPLIRALGPIWRLAAVKDTEVITLAGGATVRIHRPPVDDGRGRALLWIHSGGLIIGDARQDDRLCRRFCERLGITVASVDYRLAPEHPYPAALHDCYAALKSLAAQPTVDTTRIAIGARARVVDSPRRWPNWRVTAAKSSPPSSFFDDGSPTRSQKTSRARYMTGWSANLDAPYATYSFRRSNSPRPRSSTSPQ
jgi:hypothetical protein